MPDPVPERGSSTQAQVRVWDPVVRVFHWSLVLAFTIAYATAEVSLVAHQIAGYTALALVAFRILWGFVGSRRARFSDFVRPPAEVLRYLRETLAGRSQRFLGHNPAGGAMIVALLCTLLAIGISGHFMLTEALFGEEWLEELHEQSAHVALALIALHVLGVGVSSLVHRENLVKSMFTGTKSAEPHEVPAPQRMTDGGT